MATALEKYRQHKKHAHKRGIPFMLTYEQWRAVWDASGHWEERGPHRDQYVMSRPGDTGPYALGNVRIVLAGDNVREGRAWTKRKRMGRRPNPNKPPRIRRSTIEKMIAEGRALYDADPTIHWFNL